MTNTTTNRPHPLLDPGSLYRLGSELSIWADKGVGSIQRYYESLRVEDLNRRWNHPNYQAMLKDPRAWDWGYDEDTNRRIYAWRRKVRKAANKAEDHAVAAALEKLKQQQQELTGTGAPAKRS